MKTTFFFFFFASMVMSQKQYKIKGVIKDQSGYLVAGAKVELDNGDYVTTGFDGHYLIFSRLPYGSIKISHYECIPQSQIYIFDKKELLNIDKILKLKQNDKK